MRRRSFLSLGATPLLAPLLASCGSEDENEVEIFSWWTGAGEEEGLTELTKIYRDRHPGVEFQNSAIAGGGGGAAQEELAKRLKENDPPDSFQGHVGAELRDHIENDVIQDLSKLYEEEFWQNTFHPSLMEGLTYDGKIYGVPVNVHRANLMWHKPDVAEELGVDKATSWSEFKTKADNLPKSMKMLAIGPRWTQMQLLETVLIGELGPEQYRNLWEGQLSWRAPEVNFAISTFTSIMALTDIDDPGSDWQPQIDKVMNDEAAFAVVGDWAYSYLTSANGHEFETDYDVTPAPGTDKVFDYLSDAFILPTGAQHSKFAKSWLSVCGSRNGQNKFNTQKGSIPARSDVDKSEYENYLAWNLEQWDDPEIQVVGSLAHGAVARPAFQAAIEEALGDLIDKEQNPSTFANTVDQAFQDTRQ